MKKKWLSIIIILLTMWHKLMATTVSVADTTVQVINDSLTKSSSSLLSVDNLRPPEVSGLISFSKVFWALIFIIIGYFVIRFMTRSIEAWSEKNMKRRLRGKAIVPVVKISSWLIIAFIIVQGIFRPPVETLFAFGASIGVAIGFAAQDILKNIFGGFIILFDRPFKVSDKIEVGGVYGEVLDMSLRSTRILTPDDSVVTLPNGELMNQAISNANNGEANCQVVAEIYLPLTINTNVVRAIAMESAKTSQYIFLAKPIAVIFLNEIKHDKLCYKMRLKAYVMDTRYEFAFKSEMTEIVISELLKQQIISQESSI